MTNQSISAVSTQASSATPTALVCGALHPLVDDLQSFFRNESVAVYAEKRIVASNEYSYAVYVGPWNLVKHSIDEHSVAPKTLLIVINGNEHVREIEISAAKITGLKAFIGGEQDVLAVPIAQFFSFFFSRGKQKIHVLKTIATPDTHRFLLQEEQESSNEDSLKNSVWENETPTKKRRGIGGVTAAAAIIFCSILVFLLYPVLLFSFHSISGVAALRTMVASNEGSSIEHIHDQAVAVATSFEKAQQEFGRFSFMATILGQYRFTQFVARGLSVGKRLGSGTAQVAQAAMQGSEIAPMLSSGGSGVAARVLTVKNMLDLGDTDIAVAEAEIKSLRSDFQQFLQFFKLEKTAEDNLERLARVRHYLAAARMFLAIAPQSIGLNGKKTYLVLFQNNMELRPTGGFIGSFGTLSFEQGKMSDIQIEDVYTADGQLKGHVDPPFAIRTILGQENWYLRDSNWDPNFEVSGETAAWFLEKEMGITVDGVLAVNLTAVAKLLQATGPIPLADYNEEVTAQNLFSLAQTHAQIDFFPGSTQKRDFLGSLGKALLAQLFESSQSTQAKLFAKTIEGFRDKQILVYLRDAGLQQQIRSLGFAGSIASENCVITSCMSDFQMFVDANVGVNKANYFVKRAITDTIVFDREGNSAHTVVLLYRNSSADGKTFPGGVYRNFLRVLVPQGARVLSMKLDDTSIPLGKKDGFIASGDPVYFVDAYEDKTTFEVFFEVPTESDRRLTISYENPGTLNFGSSDGAQYVLTMQKQPGTDDDILRRSIEYPAFWQALVPGGNPNVAGASTLVRSGRLEYNSRLTTDMVTRIQFIK